MTIIEEQSLALCTDSFRFFLAHIENSIARKESKHNRLNTIRGEISVRIYIK